MHRFHQKNFIPKKLHHFPVFQTDSANIFLHFWGKGRIRPINVFVRFSFNSFISFADVIIHSFISLFRGVVGVIRTSFGFMYLTSSSSTSFESAFDVTDCSSLSKPVGIGSLPRVASCSTKFVSNVIAYRSPCGMIISSSGCNRSS